MAVVKSKRKESLLKTQVLSIQLLQKTIDVCSSKNNFPIRKKWAIPSDLYLEAREYCIAVNLANNTKVTDKETALRRLKYDSEAKEHLDRYMVLINVACLAQPMSESTINSWIAILDEAYEFFNKWYASEKKRYSELIEG